MIWLSIPIYIQTFIGMISGERIVGAINNGTNDAWESISAHIRYVFLLEFKFYTVGLSIFSAILSIYLIWNDIPDNVILAIVLFIPSLFGYHIIFNSFLSSGSFSHLSLMLMIESIVGLAIVLISVTLWPSIYGLIFGSALRVIIATLSGLILLMREFSNRGLSVKKCPPSLVNNLKFQKRGLLVKSIWSTLDVFLVGVLSSNIHAGEYRIIKSLSSIISLPAQPIWNFIRPTLHDLSRDNNGKKMFDIIRGVSLKLGIIAALFLLIIYPYVEMIVLYIYNINITDSFLLIFYSYMFATLSTNVITAWSRFVAVLQNRLDLSLKINIFISITLLVSVVIQMTLMVPVPVTLSVSLVISSIFWWLWLWSCR
ncbi:hypothetical protein BHECKSOX_1406 [Bathymodiolus heckerae thiotrophic gill symbiont]|nr:hypothetical protein BHECKSOX_1406 [Bathymodiolus heckerae thiotrophic gill symbiont]